MAKSKSTILISYCQDKKKLTNMVLKLLYSSKYQRYVDDIKIAAKATVPGLRYVEGKIIMDTTKVVEDKKRAPDERTMELIRQVGDDNHPLIKLKVDYPLKHPDKNLPILDLKVWVEQRERETQGSNQMVSVIVYEFYAKEIASKALINARSAMSVSVKRTVLSQAVLLVLLNCSPLLLLGKCSGKRRGDGTENAVLGVQ